jgi:hypothetical protein
VNLVIPQLSDNIIRASRKLNASWVGSVRVIPKTHCKPWDCHNNTINYVNWYGGTRIIGYYLLYNIETHQIGAILHSVVRRENQELIDITPFDDERSHNMFCILKDQSPDYSRPEIWFDPSHTQQSHLNKEIV